MRVQAAVQTLEGLQKIKKDQTGVPLALKGLSVFARTSASHLSVVPGGTVERITKIGARPDDCSTSLTTRGIVDHTYCTRPWIRWRGGGGRGWWSRR